MTRLWPEVSNKVARECLEAAFNLCRFNLGKYDGDYLINQREPDQPPPAHQLAYREQIRSALDASGLALLLPVGPDRLPEASETLPDWAQGVHKVFRPRSYRQLIDHLGDFLPVYLRLPGAAQWADRMPQRRTLKSLGTAGGLLMLIALRFAPMLLGGRLPHPAVLLAFLPLIALIWFAAEPKRADTERHIHLAELYHYLRREYADR